MCGSRYLLSHLPFRHVAAREQVVSLLNTLSVYANRKVQVCKLSWLSLQVPTLSTIGRPRECKCNAFLSSSKSTTSSTVAMRKNGEKLRSWPEADKDINDHVCVIKLALSHNAQLERHPYNHPKDQGARSGHILGSSLPSYLKVHIR